MEAIKVGKGAQDTLAVLGFMIEVGSEENKNYTSLIKGEN